MANDLLDKITKMEVWDVPVGNAAMLTVGLGVVNAASGVLAASLNIDPPITKAIVGVAAIKVKMVRNLLGKETAALLSAGLLATAANDAFNIEQRVYDGTMRLLGRGAETTGYIAQNSPPGSLGQRRLLPLPKAKDKQPAANSDQTGSHYYNQMFGGSQ